LGLPMEPIVNILWRVSKGDVNLAPDCLRPFGHEPHRRRDVLPETKLPPKVPRYEVVIGPGTKLRSMTSAKRLSYFTRPLIKLRFDALKSSQAALLAVNPSSVSIILPDET